ncbi:MAG TPA: glutamine-hydrolyzing GMP synthase [Bryobacteraceae bacterium]|nr:glutamine-hydrolyzing GMP synthase [Bryobacteraceae bacterium]
MTEYIPTPQIAILDTGGQYTHLIARKVRELGVYAEVLPSEVPVSRLKGRKGVIISGGPASVYEPGSPTVDPALFDAGFPVLGICYGQQLMAYALGGTVQKGDRGEYGAAYLEQKGQTRLLQGTAPRQRIWMSHRDSVSALPSGFELVGATETCAVAAISNESRGLFGVQFHPEVVHTEFGRQILSNFAFDICGCTVDWEPRQRIPLVEQHIREVVGDRNVFFFVSGGVDSTVAFTLCLHALGEQRVSGAYVDTGFMRQGETEYVRNLFTSLGSKHFQIVDASSQFIGAVAQSCDPESKRRAIGEEFVKVQEAVLQTGHFLDGHWILGQGTIYPDTIESGGTSKAEVIKTHHNRVAGIQKLIDEGKIVEPLHFFYKDEVREIGRELGLSQEFLDRHPFPGPGLAIRCLCSDEELDVERIEEGWILPIRSVGVQGDSRTYRPVLAIDQHNDHLYATSLTNRLASVNRVVSVLGSKHPLESMRVRRRTLTEERLALLREADAIVRRICNETGFEHRIWQFPVVLVPLGSAEAPDSVVLRPVESVDGMTAQSVELGHELRDRFTTELLALAGVAAVFHDLTHKPPATIEWE